MRRESIPRFISHLAIVLLLPAIAAATELRLSDDAYVSSARPTINFGGAASLTVQSPGSSTYLRFDLGSALTDGVTAADLSHAELRLFPSTVGHAGLLDVRLASGRWSEDTAPAWESGCSASINANSRASVPAS